MISGGIFLVFKKSLAKLGTKTIQQNVVKMLKETMMHSEMFKNFELNLKSLLISGEAHHRAFKSCKFGKIALKCKCSAKTLSHHKVCREVL